MAAPALYQSQPTYDALSNIIETVTTLPQGVDTQEFCYDDLSRLTWAGSSGTPSCGAPPPSDTGSLSGTSASYSASYAYDPMNRLTSGPLGGSTYGDVSHADAATAVGSTWSASYDAAGDMTCRAATSATTCAGSSPTGAQLGYDNEGQLASWQNTPTSPTQSANYLYDGAGQRVQQAVTASGATTTTSYIGALEEVTSSGSITTTVAYYGSLAESVNGALSYLLSDGLGSVSEAVNASGDVTATQLYAPYGAVRYQSGTLPTSKGYTGQRADAATSGLDYYNARYYDPVAGQFTSADTTLAGGLNRYAYVAGNPETLADPGGHDPLNCFQTPLICLILLYQMLAANGINAAGSWPWSAPPPNGVSVREFGSRITNARPSFSDSRMETAAEAGSFFNDNGGNLPQNSMPEAGGGENGQFQADEDTAYTQSNLLQETYRTMRSRGGRRNADSAGSTGSGNTSPQGAENGNTSPTTSSETDTDPLSPNARADPFDESPLGDPASAPTSTDWWGNFTEWWNNLWSSPDDTPCACVGPVSPSGPNQNSDNPDNPGVSSDDDPLPDIPFLGGYREQRQWYS